MLYETTFQIIEVKINPKSFVYVMVQIKFHKHIGIEDSKQNYTCLYFKILDICHTNY